jgi:hypothetical protein
MLLGTACPKFRVVEYSLFTSCAQLLGFHHHVLRDGFVSLLVNAPLLLGWTDAAGDRKSGDWLSRSTLCFQAPMHH